jgi:hypothetical protein
MIRWLLYIEEAGCEQVGFDAADATWMAGHRQLMKWVDCLPQERIEGCINAIRSSISPSLDSWPEKKHWSASLEKKQWRDG